MLRPWRRTAAFARTCAPVHGSRHDGGSMPAAHLNQKPFVVEQRGLVRLFKVLQTEGDLHSLPAARTAQSLAFPDRELPEDVTEIDSLIEKFFNMSETKLVEAALPRLRRSLGRHRRATRPVAGPQTGRQARHHRL